MRPTYQTLSVMLVLGFLLVIISGCGKKHLHVSTMSGAPGEGELAMGLEDTGDQSGLGTGSDLDESGLANQGTETAASSTDDLEPLDFTEEVAPRASDSQSDGDQLAGLPDGTNSLGNQGEGTDSLGNQGEGTDASGQEIQTQSTSSLPALTPMNEGMDNMQLGTPNTSMEDEYGDTNVGAPDSDSLPPLIAFNTPDDSGSGDSSSLGSENDDSVLPIEKIPGNIAVAKAEPSDAFREQLDQIREEEAAALTAGLNDVFFEFDSWTLTAEGRKALEDGAEWLNKESSAKLLIEGHCDTRGTQAYNLVLGKKRAGVIRDFLVELGITPERLSIISYGQDKPFCSDPTEVCYQLNRRGHLLVRNQ